MGPMTELLRERCAGNKECLRAINEILICMRSLMPEKMQEQTTSRREAAIFVGAYDTCREATGFDWESI